MGMTTQVTTTTSRTDNETPVTLMRQQKRWANRDRRHKRTECHGRRDRQNKTGNTETERESGTVSGVSVTQKLSNGIFILAKFHGPHLQV